MSSTVILKASGLVTSPNQLDIPDGSLTEADNIIIKRDGVIESRRGYKLHGTELPSSADRVKQLTTYRTRILRHYGDVLQYDSTGNGDFASFAESFTEAVIGLRFKSVESNGNFYLTSNNGIKKISSLSGDGLSNSPIKTAGGIKAVDLTSELQYDYKNQTGFLPQDSTVAYRALWNINDTNSNLIQGTPSQRSVIYNPMETTLVQDYLRLLIALDNISDTTNLTRIQDTDYSSSLGLDINSSAAEIRQGLVDLAEKIDNDIEYANTGATAALTIAGTIIVSGGICTITSAGTAFPDYMGSASEIRLKGLTSGNQLPLNLGFTLTSSAVGSISFLTDTGDFPVEAIDATMVITSNEYRALVTPSLPSSPATNAQLLQIQLYMSDIIQRLQQEPPQGIFAGIVISATNQSNFIVPLDITTTSTVKLRVTIPDGITIDHFIQLYRSAASQAVGVVVLSDLSPSDELKLVYEAFVTNDNLADGYIDIIDETPNDFRGANLYTNPSTGEGITQANDIPPFAKDINRFRNVVFYANTKTRHRLTMNILGVEDLIADIGNDPSLTIVDSSGSQDYLFVLGTPEVWELTIEAFAVDADDLNGEYFDIYSAKDRRKYRFYYRSSGQADTPPAIVDEVLVKIDISSTATELEVASKTVDTVNLYPTDFTAVYNATTTLEISNVEEGLSEDMSVSNALLMTEVNTQQGIGEDSDNQTVLISNVTSPAQAVDLTARSLVRVINNNSADSVYAYYISGANQVPGQILIESRSLNADPFYIIASSSAISGSFSPDLSPQYQISNIDQPTSEITIGTHSFNDGDTAVITLTDTVPVINKTFIVERISSTVIKIPEALTTVNLNTGTVSSGTFAQISENEDKNNRIYYSKYQQPESVPIVNYFDVGAEDKPILRIMPLRDSLFVFKVDGIYRVSGEVSPFNVQLFDSSTKLIAEDTVAVVDNNVYGWTEQGIASISESNVNIISRVIDEEMLKIGSTNSTNFSTATWGVGYESDNSFTVYTTKDNDDVNATIGYRYSTLTNTWTNVVKSPLCGVVDESEDVMYLAASDINFIEKERKNFQRTDYADREFIDVIGTNKYVNGVITFTDVSGMSVGDVIVQDQTLTVFQYNMLLAQLDVDTALDNDYESLLTTTAGTNLRDRIIDLANKLDLDAGLTASDYFTTIDSQSFNITSASVNEPTVITTDIPHNMFTGRLVTISGSDSNPSIDGTHVITVIGPSSFSIDVEVIGTGTIGIVDSANQNFEDIKACYNAMIDKINVDLAPDFSNYALITNNTIQESPIESINTVTKAVTLREALEYTFGEITVYESIPTAFTYSPNTMGDPLGLKHLREAQILFENRALTSATMEFATDLLPQFEVVEFDLDGNGIFGSGSFGSGFFGGGSNAAPFRTYVPRNKQYCTFMRVRFTHNTARENYTIFATTLTGEISLSSRSYR